MISMVELSYLDVNSLLGGKFLTIDCGFCFLAKCGSKLL